MMMGVELMKAGKENPLLIVLLLAVLGGNGLQVMDGDGLAEEVSKLAEKLVEVSSNQQMILCELKLLEMCKGK